MCILENQPALFRVIHTVSYFAGFHMSSEIDRVSAVFRLFENMGNRFTTPTVQLGILLTFIPALRQSVDGWSRDTFLRENAGNLRRIVALNAELDYPADNLSSFIVNELQIIASFGLFIAVNRHRKWLSRLSLSLDNSFYLLACITSIPVI